MISRSILVLAMSLSAIAFAQPKVGAAAPDFSVMDATGKTHKLADFKGKTVVLEWYNKDCPYVRKHYDPKNMQTLQADAKAKGITWLTVVSSAAGKQGHQDAAATLANATKEGSQAAAILLDVSGTMGKAYAAKTTPHMFVISPEGTLVYDGAIDSNTSSNPKTIKGATNYVTAALTSLEKGEAIKMAQTKPYGCSVKY